MAKVVSIDSKKKKKHTCLCGDTPDIDATIIGDVVATAWETHVRDGTLDDFVESMTGVRYEASFEESLDAVSWLMNDVGLLEFIVHAPGTSEYNDVGWICAFRLSPKVIAMSDDTDDWKEFFSSPEMPSEIHARLMAVILYIKFNNIIETKYG